MKNYYEYNFFHVYIMQMLKNKVKFRVNLTRK